MIPNKIFVTPIGIRLFGCKSELNPFGYSFLINFHEIVEYLGRPFRWSLLYTLISVAYP